MNRGVCECHSALSAASAYGRRSARGKALAACLERPSGRRASCDPTLGSPITNSALRCSGAPRGGTGGAADRGGASPVGDRAAGVGIIGTGPRVGQYPHRKQSGKQALHAPHIGPRDKMLYAPGLLPFTETIMTRKAERNLGSASSTVCGTALESMRLINTFQHHGGRIEVAA